MSNKYADIGRQMLDEQAGREAGVITVAGGEQPDQVAEQYRLATATGAPLDAVKIDPSGARGKVARDQFQALSPATRRWLASNPDNYALAKDDTSNLNEVMSFLGGGIMRNMPIIGGMVGIEPPKPDMPQMSATSTGMGWGSELLGKAAAGWYGGQAGTATWLRGIGGTEESDAVEDLVARGLGYTGAQQQAGVVAGAYVADRSAAASAANVTTAETQAELDRIGAADKDGGWADVAKAWATSPRAMMATLVQSLGATAPQLALTAAMPASRVMTAVSAGSGSFTAEQGFTVLDEMQKSGVDVTDGAAVARFLNDGKKMEAARDRAAKRGVAIGAFDALTAGFAGRLLANARATTLSVGSRVGGEMAAQTAGGMAGEATAQLATDGRITSRAEVIGEGLAQAPMFLIEGRGQLAEARRNARANADRHQAEGEQSAVDRLVRLSGQSKLRERAAGKFQEAVAGMVQEGQDTIYLDADGVQRLYQSAQEQGIDLSGLAEDGDLSAAVATGGELAIPLDRYATLVPEALHASVSQSVRLTPGGERGPVAVDREEVQSAIAEALAELDAQQQRGQGSSGQVYDEVYGQLLSRMDQQAAERNAAVVQSVYTNLAERMGMDAWQLFQQFRINLPGAVTDRRAAPRGIDLDIDPYLDALRAGRLPDDSEVLGPSLTRGLRAAGGVVDFGGELAGMDAGKVLPGLISGNGMTLDDALAWAYQEGYITEAPSQFLEEYSDSAPDINTLLELIGNDLRDQSVRSASRINDERAGFRDRARQLADELEAKGLDLQQLTNEQVREALGYTYLEQAAYHGTPHTVDRFSLQKIGTGEGNQVYGWGLYFASQREVAEHYRTTLTGISRMPGAKSAEEMLAKTGGDRAEAIRLLKRKGDDAAVEFLRRNQNRGNLYQVEVPDNDVLLDWDAPISEQPEAVRAAIERINDVDPIKNRSGQEILAYDPTGEEIYSALGGGEPASIALRDAGIPGLRYLDGVSRGGREGSHNYVIWDEALISEPVKLNQSDVPAGEELVAVHNLSADNLLFADKLGGLPVPSIGITKAATAFDGFGDISLVGTSALADPSNGPVFSGDAYTQRFPEVLWSAVKARDADKFLASFGETYRESDTDMVHHHLVNDPDRDKAIYEGTKSATLMRAWLNEQGENPADPVMQNAVPGFGVEWLQGREFIAAVRAEIDSEAAFEPSQAAEVKTRLSEDARKAADAWIEEGARQVEANGGNPERSRIARGKMVERHLREDGLTTSAIDQVVDYALRLQQAEGRPASVDQYGTRRALRDQIGDERAADYEAWVAEKIGGLFADPQIKVGRKNVPMTLGNIVEAMTSQKVKNTEKTMTFGGGQIAAASSKQFKTLAEVQADRARIASPQEHSDAKKSVDGLLDAFRTGVVGHYTHTNYRGEIDTWSALDDAGRALAAAAKKKPADKSIRAALTKVGFNGNEVPADVIDAGLQALTSMQSMVTDYFEAKPQRAVLLSEFAGAVIPSDAPPEVRAALERAGLKIAEYDRNNEAGRSEGIRALSAELHAERGDVLFQGGETPRGSVTLRGQAGARVFDIELTAKMDASTFMHEMGHVYLEVLQDLAARPDAPAQIAQDMATINAWLGRDGSMPLEVEQHEQFARGFEAYLREGKAPSSAMRKAFAAFKVWLVAIYRSARQLNVDLTDDVRGVFDRIIASDAEIADAREGQGLTPLIAEAEAVGMSAADAAAYAEAAALAQADAEQAVAGEVLRAMQREQKAWYRAEKAKLREEVRAELRNDPVYRVIRLMRQGKMPDGTDAPEALRVKLGKDGLLDQFGQSFLRNLAGMYSVDGGVSADTAAALYGFGSGREMVDAIVNAPKFEAAVSATTDQRMADRHTDPMTDGSLPDRAMVAAHRDRQRDMMLLEVRALEARVGGRARTTAQVMKAVAAEMVGRVKLRNLQPASYRMAEAKAGRDAFKAAAAGDWAAALSARRRQLLNLELFREATRQRDKAARDAKYLAKLQTTKERKRLGKAGGSYLEQIDGLLERFDFRNVSGPASDRRASLAAWITEQNAMGRDVNIPAKLLDEAFTTPYREMTTEDLQGLVGAVRQIDHLSRLKGKLMRAGELRDAAEIDAAMAASVLASHDRRARTTGIKPRTEGIRDAFLQGRVLQGTATDLAHELDGFQEGGAVWENTVAVIRDAVYNRLNPALQKSQDDLASIYTKHYSVAELRSLSDRFPVAEVGGDVWTKGRLLSLALNWGNDGNRAAILEQTAARMSQSQVQALLGRLDARDWRFVQDVWAHVDGLWPDIAAAQKRRTGLAPEKVEPTGFAITTADGRAMSIAGGYFPLKYEADTVRGMGEEIDDFYQSITLGRQAKAATKNGHTIERVGSGGRTVKLDLGVIQTHMRDALRDIHLGDEVNYVAAVLKGPEFRAAVADVGLLQYHKSLDVWLHDVAAGEIGPRTYSEMAGRSFRQNFTTSVLTWKATTAMLQASGLMPAAVRLGYGNMLEGLKQYTLHPVKMTAYVRQSSAFMDARLRTHIEAVQAVMDAEAGRIMAGKAAMIRWGYWAISRVQGMVDAITWLAAEQVGISKFGGDVAKARAFADDSVTRAQGSGEFIDKTGLQRGTFGDNVRQSEWVKATTALQGYMIAKGNLAYSRTMETNFRDPAQAFRWSMDMVMLFSIEGIITALIQGKLPDDEDDDGIADDAAKFLVGDAAQAIVGIFPGGGSVVSSIKGFDTGGVLSSAWKSYGELVDQIADGELDKGVLRAAVGAAGVTMGVPSLQINKTLEAIQADADGKDVSPYEYIAGLSQENKK